MTKPTVNQVVVGASTRDAITSMALALQSAVRAVVGESHVYAYLGGDYTITDEVLHMDDMPIGTPDDILVYHSSFGQPGLTPRLLERPERLVLVYHNITPAEHYEGVDEEFVAGLRWGRQELSLIKDKVARAFAVSEYNARDLRQYGYDDVVVLPVGLRPMRIREVGSDAKFLHEVSSRFPGGFVLFVSQILPHKRVDLAMEAVHLLRAEHGLDVGLVVAGPVRRPAYMNDVKRMSELLPESNVFFAGEVSDEQLATLYRSCSLYLGTSDHEGLALPPLEAMALGAPVVVRGCGAVPETVGDAAIVVPGELGVCSLTEALSLVLRDADLRSMLRARGFERARQIEATNPTEKFVEELGNLLS